LGLGEDKNRKKEVEAKGVMASSAQKWKGDSRKRLTATKLFHNVLCHKLKTKPRPDNYKP
jgi:hypothetical protein